MNSAKTPKVAVIAVHGVGYHEPGASADAVSALLLGLPEKGQAKYDPLAAETVHIPLHPLTIAQPLEPEELGMIQKTFESLEERTSFLTRKWKTSKETKKSIVHVADDFMRLTLQEYRGAGLNKTKDARDATAYITTRLKTTRVDQGPGTGAAGSVDQSIASSSSPGSPGNSTGDPDKKRIDVHIYEMYWADLSRPKNTILSFFQALYQLLFHLASLSRLAVSTGYLENQDQWQWGVLERSQKYAVRMLTLPIPILNFLLLATLFGVAPRLIKVLAGNDPVPRAAAIGALILGLLGYAAVSPSLNAKRGPLKWALYPLAFAVPLAGIAYWAASTDSRHIVLSAEALIVGSVIFRLSVVSYDDVRDGAKEVALGLWLLWVGVIAWCWNCAHADSVQQATLWTIQIVLAALRFSWLMLFLFSFAALGLGAWALCGIKDKDRRARAKAAVRTSAFALAMPTLGILIVTLALWSGLFIKATEERGQYGNSIAVRLFGDSIKELRSGPSLLHSFFLDAEGVKRYLGQPPASFTVNTSVVSAPTPVNISATYEGNSQIATLTVNPAALNLNLNPTTVTGGTPSTGTVTLNGPVPASGATVALKSSDRPIAAVPENVTVTQGSSVANSGAATLPGVAVAQDSATNPASLKPNEYFQGLFVWSATPGFPLALGLTFSGLFLLVLWALPSVWTESEKDSPVRSNDFPSIRMGVWLSRGLDATKDVVVLAWCAAFVVPAVFGAYYAFHGVTAQMRSLNELTAVILEYLGLGASSLAIVAALAGSGSPVLGAILDVDNYLRTSPKEETPRARIMERYVSLLSYLSGDDNPGGGKRYDRVVIVAHSLGALISSDLLRFLKVQQNSPNIEVRLFTMGNPLRQLLNRFFPYLYEWVHLVPDNSLGPLAVVKRVEPPRINPGELPDPSLLGVDRWVSAYRSGDYVGRSLWLDEWYDRAGSANAGRIYIAIEEPPGRREEMCIGAGAHTHYWDASAPDIAEKLDELIKP